MASRPVGGTSCSGGTSRTMTELAAKGPRNRLAIPAQTLAWVALWSFWVFVSRHNHPNLRLNAIASGLLVATFAAAVYANHLWLIPRLWSRRRFAAYAAAFLLVMGFLALACTAAIHV